MFKNSRMDSQQSQATILPHNAANFTVQSQPETIIIEYLPFDFASHFILASCIFGIIWGLLIYIHSLYNFMLIRKIDMEDSKHFKKKVEGSDYASSEDGESKPLRKADIQEDESQEVNPMVYIHRIKIYTGLYNI